MAFFARSSPPARELDSACSGAGDLYATVILSMILLLMRIVGKSAAVGPVEGASYCSEKVVLYRWFSPSPPQTCRRSGLHLICVSPLRQHRRSILLTICSFDTPKKTLRAFFTSIINFASVVLITFRAKRRKHEQHSAHCLLSA